MHDGQREAEELHRTLGLNVGDTPGLRGIGPSLIAEEACELLEAVTGRRVEFVITDEPSEHETGLLAAIRELCDLRCCIYGTAVSYGVDLEPFADEVHRANLEKSGGPERPDGKLLKPPGWVPPDVASVFADRYPDSEDPDDADT